MEIRETTVPQNFSAILFFDIQVMILITVLIKKSNSKLPRKIKTTKLHCWYRLGKQRHCRREHKV